MSIEDALRHVIPLGFVLGGALQSGLLGVLLVIFAIHWCYQYALKRQHINQDTFSYLASLCGLYGFICGVLLTLQLGFQFAVRAPGFQYGIIKDALEWIGFRISGNLGDILLCDTGLLLLTLLCGLGYWTYSKRQQMDQVQGDTRYRSLFLVPMATVLLAVIVTGNPSILSVIYILYLLRLPARQEWNILTGAAVKHFLGVHLLLEYVARWSTTMWDVPHILTQLMGVTPLDRENMTSIECILAAGHLFIICLALVLYSSSSVGSRNEAALEWQQLYRMEGLEEPLMGAEPSNVMDENNSGSLQCSRQDALPMDGNGYAIGMSFTFGLVALCVPSLLGLLFLILCTLLAWGSDFWSSKHMLEAIYRPVLSLWIMGCYIAHFLIQNGFIGSIMEPLTTIGVNSLSSWVPWSALVFALLSTYVHQGKWNIQWIVNALHIFHANKRLFLGVLQLGMIVTMMSLGGLASDVVHEFFVLSLTCMFIPRAFILKPNLSVGLQMLPGISLMQTFSSLVVLLMYWSRLSCFSMLEDITHPKGLEGVLSVLGLWEVTLADISLVMAILIMATLIREASIDCMNCMFTETEENDECYDYSWHMLTRLGSDLGFLLLATTCYIFSVQWVNAVSFLSLLYLLCGATILFIHPKTHRWETDDVAMLTWGERLHKGHIVADRRRLQLLQGIPLGGTSLEWSSIGLLSLLSIIDASTQVFLIFINILRFEMPDWIQETLDTVLGFDGTGGALERIHNLARPFAVLSLISAFKNWYTVTSLRLQIQNLRNLDMLRGEYGLLAFLKRFIIIHTPKAAVMVMFWQSLDSPSILGMVLEALLVLFLPLLLTPYPQSATKSRIFVLICFVSFLWCTVQYVAQLDWICALHISEKQKHLLELFGFDFCDRKDGTQESAQRRMGTTMPLKCLLLALLSLASESLIWRDSLPKPLRNNSNMACLIFWPQDPGHMIEDAGGRSLSTLVTTINIVPYLNVPMKWLRVQFGRILVALEWSVQDEVESESSITEEDQMDDSNQLVGESAGEQPAMSSILYSKMTLLRFALQQSCEHMFDDWGSEFTLFMILLTSFSVSNALSMVCLAILAVNMCISEARRGQVWRFLARPVFSAILVWQYFILIFSRKDSGTSVSKDVFKIWLGAEGIDDTSMWAFFLSTCLISLQVSRKFIHSQFPRSRSELPSSIWAPLVYSERRGWHWHDWIRYLVFRWYMDIVLVAVVGLCTVDNDIIHAGYLALAFFFFRSRLSLRYRKNSIFRWLPTYNMFVMTIVLMYQAPFEDIWNISLDDTQSCTLAHLVGLYKIKDNSPPKLAACAQTGLGSWRPYLIPFLSRQYGRVFADIVLWLLIRIQTHIFESSTYEKVVQVVEMEEDCLREKHQEQQQLWKEEQAANALQASENRYERTKRIEMIKKGVDKTVNKLGSGINLTGVDYMFLEESGTTAQNEVNRSESKLFASEENFRPILRQRAIGLKSINQDGKQPTMIPPLTQRDSNLQLEDSIQGSPVHSEFFVPSWSKKYLNRILKSLLYRADSRESSIAYILFVIAYASDFSLSTLMLPLSAFMYALVSVEPSTWYWQGVLIYSEILIILNYGYQIPARLDCGFIGSVGSNIFDLWGIHANAARCMPLFAVYLATLFHTFGLMSRHAAAQRSTRGGLYCSSNELEMGLMQQEGHTTNALDNANDRNRVMEAISHVSNFIERAFRPHEGPPSFVIVTLQLSQGMLKSSNQQMARFCMDFLHEELRRYSTPSQPVGDLKLNLKDFVSSSNNAARPMEKGPSDCQIKILAEVVPSGCSRAALAPSSLVSSVLSSSLSDSRNCENECRLLEIENHSRNSQDWYALSTSLDMMCFVFVALYYNKMVKASGSIQEITTQHVVPLQYLVTLIILFAFMVLGRVVYTSGSQAGKATIHYLEIVLLFWYCSLIIWSSSSPRTSPMIYFRILMVLKCLSFALSALQLRSGFPPPASYSNGMGRHTLIFMRSISAMSAIAFHIFTAVPFLYEIRQILDWSCTATSLSLYDWLKLEDINMSLYFAAVMQRANSFKPVGARQPRYMKFFQGGLFLFGVLLLLWVPLLIFSSGNPTTEVPSIRGVSTNVTITAIKQTRETKGWTNQFSQVWMLGGNRCAWGQWMSFNSSLPPPLDSSFVGKQFQLTCASADSESSWNLSPPAIQDTLATLTDEHAHLVLTFGWSLSRDIPIESNHGGPMCHGSQSIFLSWKTRESLKDSIIAAKQGQPDEQGGLVELLRVPLDEPIKSLKNTSKALIPAVWLMRGDSCNVRAIKSSDLDVSEALPGRRIHPDTSWADLWLSCKAGAISDTDEGMKTMWWRFKCSFVNQNGSAFNQTFDHMEFNACPEPFGGPSIVAFFDRVQAGILGETINKFGVIGLYTVFVYGIGRFLRLSITNLRMRIPYENFPTTRRIVSLCQDIYIARAEGLLELEEELYGALLAVYRLPNVMFELTKKTN